MLVIACPHALGLAIPLVIAISTERAARAGVLVKDRLALERMRTVDVVLFDKTGTLTKGEHAVTGVAATAGTSDDELLALAAAVEADSEHPVARAIVAAAAGQRRRPSRRGHRLPVPAPAAACAPSSTAPRCAVGGPALLRELRRRVPDDVAVVTDGVDAARRRGAARRRRRTRCSARSALEDEVRPESRAGRRRAARAAESRSR